MMPSFKKMFGKITCFIVIITVLSCTRRAVADVELSMTQQQDSRVVPSQLKDSLKNNSQWIADSKKVQEKIADKNVPDDKKCMIIWNWLWPWAKKGKLDARMQLLEYLLPARNGKARMRMPGSNGNEIALRYDLTVLLLHAEGRGDGFGYDANRNVLYSLIYPDPGNEDTPARTLFQCLKNNGEPTQRKNCVSRAVKENMIPSFQEYASQIDARIASGMRPTCDSISLILQ